MTGSRHVRWALPLVAMMFVAPHVAAQNPSVIAEALFQEGKRLMADGKFAEACPKLAESNKLDPGAGALTAAALCHKSEGKTASAWIEFKEVVSLARRDGRKDREQVALGAIAELEPKLSRLRITVTFPALRQNVEVRLDDVVVTKAAYGQFFPADPGQHSVTARALGKKPFETSLKVEPDRDEKTVDIPMLEPDQTAAAANVASRTETPVDARPASSGTTQRYIGYSVAGLGVVSLAVGGIFGLKALSKNDESNALCGDPCPVPEGLTANDDARSLATLSNVFMGAGLLVLAGGVVIALTAPKGSAARTALIPTRAGTWTF